MKEFKILQIKRSINRKLYFVEIGTVKILNQQTKLDEVLDDIWHACNVLAWDESDLWETTRRINLDTLTMAISEEFSGVANSDIIITNGSKINFTAEMCSWKSHQSLKEAKRSLMDRYSSVKLLQK